MQRRRFLGTIGASIALAANAQSTRKLPRVGVLHPASVEDSTIYQRLVPDLAKLGYVDGRSVTFELRSGKGVADALPQLVAELVALDVDVLVVAGPRAVKTAAAATRSIPIVAVDLESDPVQAGWVTSLSRPGGNVTGLFLAFEDMSAKWLQLLREAVPGARDVSLLWDAASGDVQIAATRAAAAKFGMRARTVPIANWVEFESALASALHDRAQAFVVLSSPTAFQSSARFAEYTLRNRIPAISPFRPYPAAGGLMSYGPDLDLFFQRTSVMVERILRGARPADIAVEQPTKYDFVVNRATARDLKLDLPRPLLLRATELIG